MNEQAKHNRHGLSTLQAIVEHMFEETGLIIDERTAEERLQAGLQLAPRLISAIEDIAGVLDSSIPTNSRLFEPEDKGSRRKLLDLSNASAQLFEAVGWLRVRDGDGGAVFGRDTNSIAHIQKRCIRANRVHQTKGERSLSWWIDQLQIVIDSPIYAEAHHAQGVVRQLCEGLATHGVPEDTPHRLRALADRVRAAVEQTVDQMQEAGLAAKKPVSVTASSGLSSADLQRRAKCSRDVVRNVTKAVGVRGLKKGQQYTVTEIRKIATGSSSWTPYEQGVVDAARDYLDELGVDLTKATPRSPAK